MLCSLYYQKKGLGVLSRGSLKTPGVAWCLVIFNTELILMSMLTLVIWVWKRCVLVAFVLIVMPEGSKKFSWMTLLLKFLNKFISLPPPPSLLPFYLCICIPKQWSHFPIKSTPFSYLAFSVWKGLRIEERKARGKGFVKMRERCQKERKQSLGRERSRGLKASHVSLTPLCSPPISSERQEENNRSLKSKPRRSQNAV